MFGTQIRTRQNITYNFCMMFDTYFKSRTNHAGRQSYKYLQWEKE